MFKSFNSKFNSDFNINFHNILFLFHKTVLDLNKYGSELKSLFDSNLIKSDVFDDDDYLKDVLHSVTFKKKHGYPTFIVTLCMRKYGMQFRSDVTILLDSVYTYKHLLLIVNQVFFEISDSNANFVLKTIESIEYEDIKSEELNTEKISATEYLSQNIKAEKDYSTFKMFDAE